MIQIRNGDLQLRWNTSSCWISLSVTAKPAWTVPRSSSWWTGCYSHLEWRPRFAGTTNSEHRFVFGSRADICKNLVVFEGSKLCGYLNGRHERILGFPWHGTIYITVTDWEYTYSQNVLNFILVVLFSGIIYARPWPEIHTGRVGTGHCYWHDVGLFFFLHTSILLHQLSSTYLVHLFYNFFFCFEITIHKLTQNIFNFLPGML